MEKEQNPSLHFWLLTQHGRHHFISFSSPKNSLIHSHHHFFSFSSPKLTNLNHHHQIVIFIIKSLSIIIKGLNSQ